MKSGYLSAAGVAGGGTVRAPHAATTRANPTASALLRINTILLCLLWRGSRQALDESSRHICLDDDLAVGRDVADDAGNAIQARDLLPVEVGPAVEGNRNAAGVQRQPRGDHLQQLGQALPRSRRDERGGRIR